MNYYYFTEVNKLIMNHEKCKNFYCEKKAQPGFECCSMVCGVRYREDRKDLRDFQNLTPFQNWYYGYGLKRSDFTIEKAQAYAN